MEKSPNDPLPAPGTIPKHVEKEFWKNLNYNLRYEYQHMQDHEDEGGQQVMEPAHPGDWDIFKFLFLHGLRYNPEHAWLSW